MKITSEMEKITNDNFNAFLDDFSETTRQFYYGDEFTIEEKIAIFAQEELKRLNEDCWYIKSLGRNIHKSEFKAILKNW